MSDLKPLYLTKLHLKGYKSIIDCEFELNKGLNILIGKNGAGKSNLFEFIDNVIEFYPKDFSFQKVSFEMISNENNIFLVEYKKTSIEQKKIKENPSSRFQFNRKIFINKIKSADRILNGDNVETIVFDKKNHKLGVNTGAFFVRIGHKFPFALYLRYSIPASLDIVNMPSDLRLERISGNWQKFDTLSFIQDILWELEEEIFELGPKNTTFLKKNFLKKNRFKNNLIENLSFYTPIKNIQFNENISIFQDEREIIISNLRLDFLVDDTWLPWSQLSDGTKRLFYLITEITAKESGIILIEEPELGIHPHQFSLLMDFIKKESETKQIIISTHSPKALDHLDKNELGNILIASYEKGKGTQVRNLTTEEKDKASKYMEEVAFLSDYWLHSNLEE